MSINTKIFGLKKDKKWGLISFLKQLYNLAIFTNNLEFKRRSNGYHKTVANLWFRFWFLRPCGLNELFVVEEQLLNFLLLFFKDVFKYLNLFYICI